MMNPNAIEYMQVGDNTEAGWPRRPLGFSHAAVVAMKELNCLCRQLLLPRPGANDVGRGLGTEGSDCREVAFQEQAKVSSKATAAQFQEISTYLVTLCIVRILPIKYCVNKKIRERVVISGEPNVPISEQLQDQMLQAREDLNLCHGWKGLAHEKKRDPQGLSIS